MSRGALLWMSKPSQLNLCVRTILAARGGGSAGSMGKGTLGAGDTLGHKSVLDKQR